MNEKLDRIWSHRLTPGLVHTLEKIADKVQENGKNEVMIGSLDLTNSEYCNCQKLRYFGLIAKLRVNGTHVSGAWVITSWGFLFLLGKKAVPVDVKTFQNHVVERYGDNVLYGRMKNRMRSEEYWQREFQGWLLERPDNQPELFEREMT
jgi:hypothetical protein